VHIHLILKIRNVAHFKRMGTEVWIVSKHKKSLSTETLADDAADTLDK